MSKALVIVLLGVLFIFSIRLMFRLLKYDKVNWIEFSMAFVVAFIVFQYGLSKEEQKAFFDLLYMLGDFHE
ncbi:hypothetical protein ACQUY5_30265 [Bacillus cereus]|uniref:hypothetical protein n=1 Tax=Bacillus cereus TaxID=1396 RepID=UPI003D163139